LCNIFSTEFKLETADKANKKKYVQTWTNNMDKVTKPKITALKKDEEYTKITFKPDLTKFNLEKIDDDMLGVLMRRVYDLAGCLTGIKVTLNKQRLKIKSFKNYVEMYVKALQEQNPDKGDGEGENGSPQPKPTIVHEKVNDRWEVAFAVSDGNSFNQVSFVNSIATTSGGTHVNYIADQLVGKISDLVKKKNKSAPIRPVQIKNNMFLFINCLIENPAFTSQTKEQLTTKSSQFGSKCQLSDDFTKRVLKTSIVDNVLDIATRNADKELKRSDGGKKKRLTAFAKLEDANKAGTRDGRKCTLILTEGDSAKSLAVAGLAVVGRDYYGVFPLRGKLLNVREASHDQIMKNAEIQAIKQIMGLQHKKHYSSTEGLRYGHIMIMTDQDHDGSHIKGLIINFLETSFPGLLDLPGFLVEFITPIVKVSVMRGKRVERVIPFYTMPQYEHWRDTEGKTCVWKQKYYKGLGTSDPNTEGREYFSQLDKHLKTFHNLQDGDKNLIELAFGKKKADARKDWLRAFKPGTHLDPDLVDIPISDFINKELILFSMADNIRSIPSVLDGLKPGQRKILYGCFMRNLSTDIKVAQLGGYVSEHTGYHHGEQSLYQTIVGLAQDFVGSNNLNFLMPKGSFGSRALGGKDASAPRYIFTELNSLTRKIFNSADDPLYRYMDDDESTVEPEWYLPILPTVLVNGSEGIGTGWSTSIPPFNPVDIVNNLKRMMDGQEPETMEPWFRGWGGSVERIAADKFQISGKIEQIDDKTVEITELPARMWTQTMKEYLLNAIVKDKQDTSGWIDDFTEEHTTGIKFVVTMTHKQMENALAEGLYKRFKLTTTLSLANMVAFDPQGRIKKYETVEQILSDFYYIRLEYYQKRKDYMCERLRNQLEKLSQQARFIKMIVEKKFSVSNKKKADLMDELAELKFPKFGKDGVPVYQTSKEDETVTELDILVEQEDDPEAQALKQDQTVNKPEPANYDYLLGMAIWSLTRERYERLMKERDNKEGELTDLLKKSPKDLWNIDLDDFLVGWDKFMEEDEEKRNALLNETGSKTNKKGRKGGGRKKKANDDDDDFVPGASKKKTVKKEPKETKTTKPKQTKLALEKKPSEEPETGTSKSKDTFGKGGVSNIFGSPPSSKKKAGFDGNPTDLFSDLMASSKATKSAPKKKSVFDDLGLSDDDDDLFVSSTAPSTAPASKPKAAAAKPKASTNTTSSAAKGKAKQTKKPAKPADDDSDEEMVEAEMASSTPKPARTSRSRAGPKSYALTVSDDEDEGESYMVDDDDDDTGYVSVSD
jgi:DNA gyrase/topoisomerase IV subunit B/DNA gyrase/topoisomerase IV subunit A